MDRHLARFPNSDGEHAFLDVQSEPFVCQRAFTEMPGSRPASAPFERDVSGEFPRRRRSFTERPPSSPLPQVSDDSMMHCKCGYSCGTEMAFARHVLHCAYGGIRVCESESARGTASCPPSEYRVQPMSAAGRFSVRSFARASSPKFSGLEPILRLLLIRHGESANRHRAKDEPPSKDPGLTELGHKQAEAVAGELLRMHLGDGEPEGAALLVSSPMRRCLLTVHPGVRRLAWTRDYCLCHGGAFEFGCAGLDYVGSSCAEVVASFPEFQPVEFNAAGHWDYQGHSGKENHEEFVARGARLVDWLLTDAMRALRSQNKQSAGAPRIILCIHQTLADLLGHLLLESSPERFSYGDPMLKMDNASFSEILLYEDHQAALGMLNAVSHLFDVV